MCEYTNNEKCKITGEICPYMYFCEKRQIWKASRYMPNDCTVKINNKVPKGYTAVIQERNGYLYVCVNGQTIKLKNPFDTVPLYVKVYKQKNGQYRLKL